MASKSKTGSSGRFGSRYGARLRKKVSFVESTKREGSNCPSCASGKTRRISKGIWQCRKCNYKFAGGAYTPFKKREEIAK